MAKMSERFLLENLLKNAECARGGKSELIYVWQGNRFRPLRYTIRFR